MTSAATEPDALSKYRACMAEAGFPGARLQWAEQGGRLETPGEPIDGIVELVIGRYDYDDDPTNRAVHVAVVEAFKQASRLVHPDRHRQATLIRPTPQHYASYVYWAEP